MPSRKEPISFGVLRAMLAAPAGTRLPGARTLSWQSWSSITIRALLCTAASGVFRKAELGLPAGVAFNKTNMSRASLFWVIRGAIVSCPTVAHLRGLRGLREGDLAGLVVAPCKNGPWGHVFMAHPLFVHLCRVSLTKRRQP